jgi:formylglycine-generating enzyme required for sulfatase activity
LSQQVRKILKDGTDHDALVLFLDQMEELFTAHTPDQAKQFLQVLYQAAQDGALWVLSTIRSDHLHHCHAHPDMLRVLRGPGHYPLGPIEPFMLPDLIAKPALCAGLSISDHLVRRIVHETMPKGGDERGADQSYLPLLAFVLNHLFAKRADHELSERVYQDVGGVAGAVAHHAGQVEIELHRMLGGQASQLLAKLFESMVIVSAEGLPTRRRPLFAQLPSDMRVAIEVLVKKRLLRTEGQGEQSTVSISHEKLFEAWPSLKDYVAKNKKKLMDRTLLESRAKKWVDMGKPWFSGLAAGWEYRDFRRAGMIATPEIRDYFYASHRMHWIVNGAMAVVMVLIAETTWLWQKGYSVDQAMLKVKSLFVSIHVEPAMQLVPAGIFQQGNILGLGKYGDQPTRKVTIKLFAMGKYEVTFEEYDRFAIATGRSLPNDQGWGRGRRPVINVSWDDTVAYADWLSKATTKQYRLPTAHEWEYAARSGGKDDTFAGTSDSGQLGAYAIFADNSHDRTSAVGERMPNGLGLYDMSGNVWEWTEGCYPMDFAERLVVESLETGRGGMKCTFRMIRGGSWGEEFQNLTTFGRNWDNPANRSSGVGFRLVQDIN